MREMHKWKDKVELSLDNRQIFFLFFGASVVGCFVFALGVMVGRRVDFDTVAQAGDEPGASLALLDTEMIEPSTYVAGLREQGTPAPVAEPAFAATVTPAAAESSGPAKVAAATEAPAAVKAGKEAVKKSTTNTVPASSTPASASRRFTLQIKAFANANEAEAFAAPIRANGHDVRVEAHEVKGRVWHRVRMGEFESWDQGLAAKGEFEKAEKNIIAYVVRL